MSDSEIGDHRTARQRREIDYHREFARENDDKITEPLKLDIALHGKRRWWNAYWHLYTKLRAVAVTGKRVLVVGAGFGDDAIRLSMMGAEVDALDISPEIIEVARARGARLGVSARFHVMPAERLSFADNLYDIVFLVDILHHVDISSVVAEISARGAAEWHDYRRRTLHPLMASESPRKSVRQSRALSANGAIHLRDRETLYHRRRAQDR